MLRVCRASDEHPGVARPLPGGEKRRGRLASHHEACEAIGVFLLLCAATGVSLLAVWCLSGATPRGQPRKPAVTLSPGRNGQRVVAKTVAFAYTRRALYCTRAPPAGDLNA